MPNSGRSCLKVCRMQCNLTVVPRQFLRTCALEAEVMFVEHVKTWLSILATEGDPYSSLLQVFLIILGLQQEGLACIKVFFKMSGKIAEILF